MRTLCLILFALLFAGCATWPDPDDLAFPPEDEPWALPTLSE